MIIDLPSTTTSHVNNKLVELREQGGAVTLGRVLTLVIVTDDGAKTEDAVESANQASREHPCRVIVVARGAKRAAARLDAQIRVGGDAGASEVVVLRLYGQLADEGASCVVPLLLPDTPVVAWWPNQAPDSPAKDPIGRLAQRRITDTAAEKAPIKALEQRRRSYAAGDTDLAWTRLTLWRAMLASALDLPPFEKVTEATVIGEADSPSTDLLAAWLAVNLKIPVRRAKATSGEGIVQVTLNRKSGPVELLRPDGKVGALTQPGQPERRVALQRRTVTDCLTEEMRRLDADEIYDMTLKGLSKVVTGRASAAKATVSKAPVAKPPVAKAAVAKSPASSSSASNSAATGTTRKPAKSTPRPKSAKRVPSASTKNGSAMSFGSPTEAAAGDASAGTGTA